MSVVIEGLEESVLALTMKASMVDYQVRLAVMAGAEEVKNDAVESIMRGTKSGISYKKGGVTHTASAKGEAPASDTGRLANSILSLRNISDSNTYLVGSNVTYGKFLEFGTKDIEPRPWLIPSLEKNRAYINRIVTTAIKDSTK